MRRLLVPRSGFAVRIGVSGVLSCVEILAGNWLCENFVPLGPGALLESTIPGRKWWDDYPQNQLTLSEELILLNILQGACMKE